MRQVTTATMWWGPQTVGAVDPAAPPTQAQLDAIADKMTAENCGVRPAVRTVEEFAIPPFTDSGERPCEYLHPGIPGAPGAASATARAGLRPRALRVRPQAPAVRVLMLQPPRRRAPVVRPGDEGDRTGPADRQHVRHGRRL